MLTTAIFSAAHWLGVGTYLGSLVFLLIIFKRVYTKYEAYNYVDNFRAEIIFLYWKFLHIAFVVIVVSGAVLAGIRGRSVMQGAYGLIFSAKLVLWLAQIYLTQEHLKPFARDHQAAANQEKSPHREISPILIVILLLLISLCGFALKYL